MLLRLLVNGRSHCGRWRNRSRVCSDLLALRILRQDPPRRSSRCQPRAAFVQAIGVLITALSPDTGEGIWKTPFER